MTFVPHSRLKFKSKLKPMVSVSNSNIEPNQLAGDLTISVFEKVVVVVENSNFKKSNNNF